jgi:acetyl-CoA carboxylase biotin carboxyl carrier protein
MENSNFSEIEIQKGDSRIRLRKWHYLEDRGDLVSIERICSKDHSQGTRHRVADKDNVVVEEKNLHIVKSPMVGTFYSASSPESAPFVTIGSRVEKESVLCILEAMKIMNEIQSDVSGTVHEIFVDNGQSVEFGQALFAIELNS